MRGLFFLISRFFKVKETSLKGRILNKDTGLSIKLPCQKEIIKLLEKV